MHMRTLEFNITMSQIIYCLLIYQKNILLEKTEELDPSMVFPDANDHKLYTWGKGEDYKCCRRKKFHVIQV